MLDMKMGYNYLNAYLDHHIFLRKVFQFSTIIFSASGIVSWIAKKPEYAGIACAVIFAMDLLKKIEPFLIRTENDITEIRKLTGMYNRLFDQYEKLFIELKSNEIAEDKAKDEFFQIRSTFAQADDLDNVIGIKSNWRYRHLKKKARNKTYNYLNLHYLKTNSNDTR